MNDREKKRLASLYYTAAQAREQLGIDERRFQYWVAKGDVQKVILPGRKQGVYPKRDIDALALALNWIFEQGEDRFVFSRSTPGDQVEEMDIGIRCFGSEFITPLPERIAFQQKSEFTFWSLKVLGRVVGYISMFHFPAAFLDDILAGRRIEREITVKEVLPFTRGEPSFSVYIDVMAIDPRLPHHERNLYAGIIVSRFTDVILNLRANGYQIDTLYTVTATKEGDNLVRKAGFHLMEGKSQAPGRVAYEYRLDEAGLQRLKEFSRREID